MPSFIRALLIAVAGVLLTGSAASAAPLTPVLGVGGTITIDGGNAADANPFPSTITFSGSAVVTDVDVEVTFGGHSFPDDLEVMIGSPDNRRVILMGDDCGGTPLPSGRRFWFDDEAPTVPSDDGPCNGLTYRPAGVSDFFTPTGPRLSTFAGAPVGGSWNLRVHDDSDLDGGSITGWRLIIHYERFTNDAWASALALNAASSALSTFVFGPNSNQAATLETIPTKSGTIDERAIACGDHGIGKTTWYTLFVPSAGSLRLDAVYRPDDGADIDWDDRPLDAIILLTAVDPADGKLKGLNDGAFACAQASGPGVTESLLTDVPAGAYRIGVGGTRSPDYGADGDNASDGEYELRGQFTTAPRPADPTPPVTTSTPPPAPDGDQDGIPDAFDRCPTVKPRRDADRDGCSDVTPRVSADLTYEWAKWRRAGELKGAAIQTVKVAGLPAGATVRLTCARCRILKDGRNRAFKPFTVKARRKGTLRVKGVRNILVPKGRRLVVSVTQSGRVGRRFVIRMGRRRPAKSSACLAVGRTDKQVPCPPAG